MGQANGFGEFVRRGRVPDTARRHVGKRGFLADNISRVYFPGASGRGLIEPGRYSFEDWVRATAQQLLLVDLISRNARRSLAFCG